MSGKRWMYRIVRSSALVVAAGLITTSCWTAGRGSTSTVPDDALYGKWSSKQGVSLTLKADRTFTIADPEKATELRWCEDQSTLEGGTWGFYVTGEHGSVTEDEGATSGDTLHLDFADSDCFPVVEIFEGAKKPVLCMKIDYDSGCDREEEFHRAKRSG